MKKTLIIVLLTSLSQFVVAQGFTKPHVSINNANGNLLTLDKQNILHINVAPNSFDTILVTSTNGSVYSNFLGEGFYSVEPDTLGSCKLTVLGVKNKTETKLISTNYKVDLSIEEKRLRSLEVQPNINLAGRPKGRVRYDSVKNISCLSINPRYKIIDVTVYLSSAKVFSDPIVFKLTNSCWSESLGTAWKRITDGSTITFTNIQLFDKVKKQRVNIPDISFLVTKDYNGI